MSLKAATSQRNIVLVSLANNHFFMGFDIFKIVSNFENRQIFFFIFCTKFPLLPKQIRSDTKPSIKEEENVSTPQYLPFLLSPSFLPSSDTQPLLSACLYCTQTPTQPQPLFCLLNGRIMRSEATGSHTSKGLWRLSDLGGRDF